MKQNDIIFQFIKDNLKQKNIEPINNNVKVLNTINHIKKTHEYNGVIHHICELKKEDLLIIDIINPNNNNEELYIHKKNLDYNFDEIHCLINEDEEILSLSELKNGQLLVLQKNKFKIYEITNKYKVPKLIQEKKLEDKNYYFKEKIELINGNLISLTFSSNPQEVNKIFFWNKDLMTGKYERKKVLHHEKAIAIIEKDKYSFIIVCDNNKLYNYYLYQNERKKFIGSFNENVSINDFQKIVKIEEDGLLFIYKEFIIMLNLTTLQSYKLFGLIDAIYNIKNSDYCLASFNNNFNGIYLISYNLQKNLIKCDEFQGQIYNNLINCIYQLNNGDIITGSLDKNITLFNLNKKINLLDKFIPV